MEREVRDRIAGIVPPVLEQSGPLVGKEVGVVGTLQQVINDEISFIGLAAGEELRGLFCGGQPPGDVERDAPQERRVIAHRRRGHTDHLEIRKDLVIHKVPRRRQLLDRSPQRDRGTEHRHLPLIADHHRRLAGDVAGLHQAAIGDFGHARVVRFVDRQRRHIARRPVRVPRDRGQLLFGLASDRAALRLDREGDQLGSFQLVRRCPLGNPGPEDRISLTRIRQSHPAPMRQQPRSLPEDQTLLRNGRRQPSPAIFLGQVFEVFQWLEPEQRQLKPVPPAPRLGVAVARVAPRLGQHRHHIIGKTDRQLRCGSGRTADAQQYAPVDHQTPEHPPCQEVTGLPSMTRNRHFVSRRDAKRRSFS